MSRLRRRIAERLVEAQRTAAILTTFNEVDLSALLAARRRHREAFRKRHGVDLGLMSLFGRACVGALRAVPVVNAQIEGADIVYHRQVHLGIAVSTERGLVVPVIRGADSLELPDLERRIEALARRVREGKITPDELSGAPSPSPTAASSARCSRPRSSTRRSPESSGCTRSRTGRWRWMVRS
jgi:2-oxoglutarate dehydrogenase E2 component (dihydrolipoamide succinyltransferase)